MDFFLDSTRPVHAEADICLIANERFITAKMETDGSSAETTTVTLSSYIRPIFRPAASLAR
jgi:hypothetical protein